LWAWSLLDALLDAFGVAVLSEIEKENDLVFFFNFLFEQQFCGLFEFLIFFAIIVII